MTPTDAFSAILDAREARTRRRLALVEQYGGAIVTVTMNIPGPDKAPLRYARAFREFLDAISAFWKGRDPLTRPAGTFESAAGMEAHLATSLGGNEAKRLAVEFEQSHPWGRCFDVDILDANGVPVSRSALDLPERSCLCCDRPARLCARERTHALSELLAAIDSLLDRPLGP